MHQACPCENTVEGSHAREQLAACLLSVPLDLPLQLPWPTLCHSEHSCHQCFQYLQHDISNCTLLKAPCDRQHHHCFHDLQNATSTFPCLTSSGSPDTITALIVCSMPPVVLLVQSTLAVLTSSLLLSLTACHPQISLLDRFFQSLTQSPRPSFTACHQQFPLLDR